MSPLTMMAQNFAINAEYRGDRLHVFHLSNILGKPIVHYVLQCLTSNYNRVIFIPPALNQRFSWQPS